MIVILNKSNYILLKKSIIAMVDIILTCKLY